jgi:hypothetical protein
MRNAIGACLQANELMSERPTLLAFYSREAHLPVLVNQGNYGCLHQHRDKERESQSEGPQVEKKSSDPCHNIRVFRSWIVYSLTGKFTACQKRRDLITFMRPLIG